MIRGALLCGKKVRKYPKKRSKEWLSIRWTYYLVYYNYHAVAKRLIKEGKLVDFQRKEGTKGDPPTFLLIFDGHRPMPIREERVPEYVELIKTSPSSHLVGSGDPKE